MHSNVEECWGEICSVLCMHEWKDGWIWHDANHISTHSYSSFNSQIQMWMKKIFSWHLTKLISVLSLGPECKPAFSQDAYFLCTCKNKVIMMSCTVLISVALTCKRHLSILSPAQSLVPPVNWVSQGREENSWVVGLWDQRYVYCSSFLPDAFVPLPFSNSMNSRHW